MPKTIFTPYINPNQLGKVEWIGVRPAPEKLPSGHTQKQPMQCVDRVEAVAMRGLTGDRYHKNGDRQVTLIQWEHLDVIAKLLGQDEIAPQRLRRNIAVSGINLLSLRGQQFKIGKAIFEYTGLCDPCSAMEKEFGPGGFNAIWGHGGITARIITSGVIALNDSVTISSSS